jgi:hypothetical protein
MTIPQPMKKLLSRRTQPDTSANAPSKQEAMAAPTTTRTPRQSTQTRSTPRTAATGASVTSPRTRSPRKARAPPALRVPPANACTREQRLSGHALLRGALEAFPSPSSAQCSPASYSPATAAAVDDSTLELLTSAVKWHSDDGKQARMRLWRVCDAPSPSGQLSPADVDRWVRSLLGCPSGFATQRTVQRMFDAATQGLQPGRAAHDYIEPGIAFWRLLLLVGCYVQLYLAFAPPEGASTWIDPDECVRMAAFLSGWGVPSLGSQQAATEVATFGGAVRFHELCDWGVERLLAARAHGGAAYFRDLEAQLVGAGGSPPTLRHKSRPIAVALPLEML